MSHLLSELMNEKAINAVSDQRFYGFEATYLIDRLQRTKHSLMQLVQGQGQGLGERRGSEPGLTQESGPLLVPADRAGLTTWKIDECIYLNNGKIGSEGVEGSSTRGDSYGYGDINSVHINHRPVHVCPAKAIDYAILRYHNHHHNLLVIDL